MRRLRPWLIYAQRWSVLLAPGAGFFVIAWHALLADTITSFEIFRASFWVLLLFGMRRLVSGLFYEPVRQRKSHALLSAVSFIGCAFLFHIEFFYGCVIASIGCETLFILAQIPGYGTVRWLRQLRLHPARSFVLSFMFLIVLGTLLLRLPAASHGHVSIAWLDAFFTAVSAVCVTGLATVDTASTWTPFGWAIIFGLFQLGALGIMVLSGSLMLLLGQRMSLGHHVELAGVLGEQDQQDLQRLLRTIIAQTILIEAVGALCLWPAYLSEHTWWAAFGYAAFHAVSAFCNAGFALHAESLMPFVGNLWVNGVTMTLIVLGGLGFSVIAALIRSYRRRKWELPVHAWLVLWTSAALIAFGWVTFFFFEYAGALDGLSWGEKLLASLFQSVSTRTAGFNTVHLSALHPATLICFFLLMSVGASAGSTGGGLKTTTFAVTFLAMKHLRQHGSEIIYRNRYISAQTVFESLALIGGFLCVLFTGLLVLVSFENLPFESLIFEAISALGTVGLSTGITAELSAIGQLALCVLMFIGRVGALTFLAALSKRRAADVPIRYPEADIALS